MADRGKLIELIREAQKGNMLVQWGDIADHLLASGVVMREEGIWEYFVETSFNGEETDVYDFGWRCSHCKKPLEEVVGGYWDDDTEMPTLNFCPNCGAKMDGERRT